MRDDTSTAYRRFPVIYIAGPYTAGDPAANVHRAVNIAHYLMDHGLAWPLVPHLSHLWHLIAPRPYADWIALDFALLERCDGLIRLPGVSTGADGETDWCTEHGVPWIALTDAWAADSSLGLRSWIEEHWPNDGAVAVAVAEWRRRHRAPHPLAPPRPLLIRNTTTKGTRP